jgi:hypothetical protein
MRRRRHAAITVTHTEYIELTICGETSEFEVECEGSYSSAFEGSGPSMDNAGGEPPHGAEIEDLQIGYFRKDPFDKKNTGAYVDLLDIFPEKQIDAITEKLLILGSEKERDGPQHD